MASFSRFERALANMSFFDDVFSEITSFVALRGCSVHRWPPQKADALWFSGQPIYFLRLSFPRIQVGGFLGVSRPLPIHFQGPSGMSESSILGSSWRGKLALWEFVILEHVLNEITTFHPLRGLSREAKCAPCASLRHVRVLLHM